MGSTSKTGEFSERFQRGGGRAFSIHKFILQILGTLNSFWARHWNKRIISGFRVCYFNNCILLQLHYTYLWKSCACISYYLTLIPPCIYATISIIKKLQYKIPKMRVGEGFKGRFFSSENSSHPIPPFPKCPVRKLQIAWMWNWTGLLLSWNPLSWSLPIYSTNTKDKTHLHYESI